MKKKLKYFAIIFTLVTALLIFTNIYLLFLGPLDIGTEVKDGYGDAILVLGGGLKKGLELGYSTEERLMLAVELFKQKKRKIIVSGGSLYKRSPARKKITDFFKRNGIDETNITFEGKSQTTYDHFSYATKLINDMKYKEIIVSTSPYHHRRSLMILSYLELKNFKISHMNRSEIYQADSIGQRLRNLKLVVREYLAILKFKIFKR
ncbi:MAG: YdcF family protein [bacterium]|nr:YdcF family protein [bacterium]